MGATIWQTQKQLGIAREQMRVELYLRLRARFDSDKFRDARHDLAYALQIHRPSEFIKDTVMDFFEDMGMLLRRGYLDPEMVADTFSFHTLGWWHACREYIVNERHNNDDECFYTDFEELAAKLQKNKAPSSTEKSLEDEMRLTALW